MAPPTGKRLVCVARCVGALLPISNGRRSGASCWGQRHTVDHNVTSPTAIVAPQSAPQCVP